MTKRRVRATRDDLVTLLSGEAPFTRQLSEHLQEQLKELGQGSIIYLYDPSHENSDRCLHNFECFFSISLYQHTLVFLLVLVLVLSRTAAWL